METTINKYTREIVAVIYFVVSVFLLIALWSYSPLDSSWFSVSIPENPVVNQAGKIGATLSAILMYFMGVASYAIPATLIVSSILFIKYKKENIFLNQVVGTFLFVSSIIWMISKFVPSVSYAGYTLPSSGLIGQLIFERCDYYLGSGGSLIILAGTLLISVMVIFRISLISASISGVKKLGFWCKLGVKKGLDGIKKLLRIKQIETQPKLIKQVEVKEKKNPQQTKKTVQGASIKQTGSYIYPDISVLKKSVQINEDTQKEEYKKVAERLVQTLSDFSISGSIVAIHPGPVVTVYEFQPDAGIKLSKITSLIDDIALSLKVDSIFINPVKGKCAVGIEVPNRIRQMVTLGDVMESGEFSRLKSPLSFVLGKNISGVPMCAELTSMPHLLLAGATGSGKSVAINSLICSIIARSTPEEVRMILVDPKMLELSVYEGIPHLLIPVITDAAKASTSLKWAVHEMERRYRLMQITQVRNIEAYNEYITKLSASEKQKLKAKIYRMENLTDEINEEELEKVELKKLPFILIVIDELADLMLTASKDTESLIQRLAQKARASGIHLVLATQRPSVDVITGVIKANLPYRISFQVVSRHDSRTIIDQMGADKLLGQGDMLFLKPGAGRLERIQGAFISDEEVVKYVAPLKTNTLGYSTDIIDWMSCSESNEEPGTGELEFDDDKLDEAMEIGRSYGSISSSFLQRQLKIGYNRAARIVDYLESQGLVEKSDGVKPRKWLGQ